MDMKIESHNHHAINLIQQSLSPELTVHRNRVIRYLAHKDDVHEALCAALQGKDEKAIDLAEARQIRPIKKAKTATYDRDVIALVAETGINIPVLLSIIPEITMGVVFEIGNFKMAPISGLNNPNLRIELNNDANLFLDGTIEYKGNIPETMKAVIEEGGMKLSSFMELPGFSDDRIIALANEKNAALNNSANQKYTMRVKQDSHHIVSYYY